MNSLRTRARIFEEMGLGPEWFLRSNGDETEKNEVVATDHFLKEESLSESKAATVEYASTIVTPKGTSVNLIMDSKANYANWEELIESIKNCDRCELCKTRTHAVPGIGDPNADWLFIGEGPGYYEDQQGEPFVGPSGKLLDNMMAAFGMKRGEKVYIANIVKCRASDGNKKDRPPTREESSKCMPYLDWQIRQIKPKIIVALGRTAAAGLLNIGDDVGMGSLRGKVHYLSIADRKTPLIVTYHPAYLLRTPMAKKQAWIDLCLAMDVIEQSN